MLKNPERYEGGPNNKKSNSNTGNNRCWHLVSIERNSKLNQLVQNGKLRCDLGYFCDHHIPTDATQIFYKDIGCNSSDPTHCPIILREQKSVHKP